MKLALLGCDCDLLPLVRAAARGEHQIVWFHDVGDFEADLRRLAPRAVCAAEWEGLLAAKEIDAVLVARGEESLRGEQLRKLTQAGLPLLVSHPVVESMLLYYELDMIRREQQAVLVPCLPGRLHPAMTRLMDLIGEDRPQGIGRLEQLSIERTLADRGRASVLRQFSHDVDLARALCGELNKVTATASTDEAARYANLCVQMTGPAGALVRWTVEAAGEPRGRLTLRGTRGRAVLQLPEETAGSPSAARVPSARLLSAAGLISDVAKLEITHGETTQCEDFPPWSGADAALDLLARSIAARPALQPDWIDAARSVEITETIDRSLARGRTIELHFEDYSEEATFKGTMTSLGCGLLVAALVALFVAALAARSGAPFAGYYLYGLLGVLGLFLLLQLLKLVFPPRE